MPTPRRNETRSRADIADRTPAPSAAASLPHSVGPRLLAPAIAALGLAHILYLRFICDDAFISFRYAAHLVRGDGLVYNAGERVEGYTNFLWTLISALMLEAGVKPEVGTMVLGGACALATLIVAIEFCRRRGWSPWLAGTLLAASAAWAAWATSGLETAAFTLLVTAGTLSVVAAFAPRATESRPSPTARAPLAGAVLLALAALTRPEGLLVSVIVLAFLLWSVSRRRLDARAALASLGVWVVMVGPHLAWRLAYYGRWLPNTFAAKSGGPGAFEAGARYLGHAVTDLALYVPALVIVTGWVMPGGRAPSGSSSRRAVGGPGLVLVACVVVPYLILVASTGGDFMPLYRFVVPVIPLLAVWAAASWTRLAAGLAGARSRTLGVGAIAVLASIFALVNLAQSRHQQDAWTRGDMESVGYTRQDAENWRRVGELLAQVTLPTDTLATTAAGIIPYVSGLTTIDLLGLAAPDLSLYRRRDTARPGHTLMLSGDALDRMRPQILIGHPLVMPTMEHLGLSLDFEPEWRERVLASYSLFGLTLIGKPVRFTGLVLRNDVAERILAAGQRLGGVDTTGAIER